MLRWPIGGVKRTSRSGTVIVGFCGTTFPLSPGHRLRQPSASRKSKTDVRMSDRRACRWPSSRRQERDGVAVWSCTTMPPAPRPSSENPSVCVSSPSPSRMKVSAVVLPSGAMMRPSSISRTPASSFRADHRQRRAGHLLHVRDERRTATSEGCIESPRTITALGLPLSVRVISADNGVAPKRRKPAVAKSASRKRIRFMAGSALKMALHAHELQSAHRCKERSDDLPQLGEDWIVLGHFFRRCAFTGRETIVFYLD